MNKNNNTHISENKTTSALVFDRIYGSGTTAAQVIAQRIFIAAAITFFCISYVLSIYELPVNKTALPFVAAGAAVAFSLLFAAVKRLIAIPFLTVISGIVILSTFDEFWKKFSFFVDAIILECNGRLFDTTGSTIHKLKEIEVGGKFTSLYTEGVVFGSVILCVIFALITAAGVIGKPHILPSLSAFLLMWIPKMMSEKLFFGWQLIPIIALYAGMIAIGTYYRDGLAIRHVYAAGGYRRKVAMDDRRFNAAVKAQNAGQRVISRGLHYSKYFSSVMSAVAIFTVLGIVLSVVLKSSKGINYDPFYETLQNLGNGFGSSDDSPFKVGAEADYFTSPSGSIFRSNDRLKLTSPSTNTKEIIRVTKQVSKKPLYLRGDIGIDFDGVSWSSPVTDEPPDWKNDSVNFRWLPAEVMTLADRSEHSSDFVTYEMGAYLNVSVEYLCDTDVIFAPAYDMEYSLFSPRHTSAPGEYLDAALYGDFSARRRTNSSTGETLEYTAAVPYYTDASDDFDVSFFGMACGVYDRYRDNYYNYISSTITNANMGFGYGFHSYDYDIYVDYVDKHYLGVPEKMKADIDEFIERSGLDEEREKLKQKYYGVFYGNVITTTITANGETVNKVEYEPLDRPTDELADRFLSAVAVSEYLKANYTYSLDARIDARDPVMSFLNNTKSGHCALYASAMTLILREWGIPARYCTGFAANADLSMVTLRSKDLHAWVEVYLDGLGWVTFDPTALAIFGGQGSGDTSTPTSDSSSTSTSTSSGTPQDSSSAAQSESSNTQQSSEPNSSHTASSRDPNTHDSDNSESGSSVTFAQVLPYLLMILAILAAIALIVLAVIAYIRLRKRAYKQLQSFHREKNSDYVYEKLLAVLRFCKLTPANGEQPHKFFERAEQTLECDICDNYELFERLAFGETELDVTEQALLGRSFDKIFRAAEKKLWFIGRIRLRLLVLSKKT